MYASTLATVESENAAALYDETTRHHPDRVAVEMNGREYTHSELRTRSERVAGGFHELGLDPGDHVALYLHNSVEYVVAALAALKAGTPFTPLNPQLRPRELTYRMDDSDIRAVLVDERLADDAFDAIDTATVDPITVVVSDTSDTVSSEDTPRRVSDGSGQQVSDDSIPYGTLASDPVFTDRSLDDLAMLPYTSGTTGEPKGVRLTHRNLRAQSLIGFERTALDAEDERFLSTLPLAHIAGFVNRTWQPLIRGATVYLRDPEAWDPEAAMATIEREQITKFGAVTAMYIDLINHESFGEYDLSSLAEAMEGGDTMPSAVQQRFEEVTGVELFEAYGLTETGGGTHVGFGSTFGPQRGTVGQPLRATDCKVVDEDGNEVQTGEPGELLVRGPHVMDGYYERPEETDAAFTDDGYFRTGDIVRRDENNYYEVVDRKSDVIVTAGYNVYPAEVEEVLHEHPAVVEAAVVGVPDDRRGTTVTAFVVPSEGTEPTEDVLKQHCLDELAAYKHPRSVTFVETLPKTASGKIRRFALEDGDAETALEDSETTTADGSEGATD